MENKYRKYLFVSDQDKKWGFYINNLGRTIIDKNTEYPSKDHPDSHTFSWTKGRILDEFHIVLITQGKGIFETKETGKIKISDGDVFLLFPGVWHRYKPSKKTGWTERWLGFSGEIANQLLSNGFFNATDPIISKSHQSEVLHHFNTLFKLFDEEPFGFQRLASGVCIQLMAELHNVKQGGNNRTDLNSMVARAKALMYQNIEKSIDLKVIAHELGVSYSKFRLDFKKQTGIAPLQYYLFLKVEKSKELLLGTEKTLKEIAFELGIESDYYFNRLFKQKTGLSPGKFRDKRNSIL